MDLLYRAEVRFFNGLSSNVLFIDDNELKAVKNAFQWALHQVPKFAQNVTYQHPASVITSLQVAFMEIGRLNADGRPHNVARSFFNVTSPPSWKESVDKFEATFKETTAPKYATGHPVARSTMYGADVELCGCERNAPPCVTPDGKAINAQ